MTIYNLLKRAAFGCTTLLATGAFCTHAQATVFQAENYNDYYDSTTGNSGGLYRNDNVDIEKALDTDNGFNVGWIAANEWLTYKNLVIPSSGSYTINMRVASPAGARVSLDLNAGNIYLGSIPISATKGWQNWKTVSFTTTIDAGTYQLGVYAETAGWNFNWIEVIPNGVTSSSKSSSKKSSSSSISSSSTLSSIKSSTASSKKSSSSSKTSLASSSVKSSSSTTNNSGAPAGYNLVWQDEFDVAGLPNGNKWVYDTEANKTGWYNNEKQYYAVARLKNSEVTNGKLIISAFKETLSSADDHGGQNYTSARLITNGKASWTYGHFEIRAKMPCGKGTWPAIWTLGATNDSWPANGEIDIMEHVGKEPTTVHGTIWTTATENTWGDSKSIEISDACSNFHNYQMTWTADKIVFAVDNVVFHSYYNTGAGSSAWPFDKPQYLLLNLAIGGDMAGEVDDSIFPRSFEIEYVRIYQKP